MFDGIPLGEVSTSMTINAPAAVLLLMYQTVAEEQGTDAWWQAHRHRPERHPEGVHRAGRYILPRPSQPADGRRQLPPTARVSSLGGTRSPSPATTWRRPAPRPYRRSRSRWPTREGVRQRAAVEPAERRRLRRPGCRSSSSPARRCSRRSQSPRGPPDVGADHEGRVPGAGPQVADAALPHADRGRAAHRAAEGSQPVRVTIQALAAVLGGTQSLHTELLRRGDRAAEREGGPAGAADAAGDPGRDRPDQDRGPVRRLVRRRVDDRRHRGGGRAS